MDYSQNSSTVAFAKHVFLASKVHLNRGRAKEEVYGQLQRMRKKIISMNLGYSDVDRLRQKIDNMIGWERKYARLFRAEDSQTSELKGHIKLLEEELKKEREEKLMIMSEKEEKVSELTESINNIKNHMKRLMLDKAKRQHRLKVLERKIDENIDRDGYFSS